jgi:RNA polymerase sigma-70 factor (ECF subfamily)
MSGGSDQPGAVAAGEESDALLAQRWQGGDLRSGESLIRRHAPRLHAFLASRALNAHEAEDLAQEVFVAVARRIALYQPGQPFLAWLYGIARNKIADAWRAHRPSEVFEERHEGADFRTPASLHESAESAAAAWREVFARLPETQASALWLRVQEDLSLDAIASTLEVSVANAKVLLFRARQTLSRTWKPSLIS